MEITLEGFSPIITSDERIQEYIAEMENHPRFVPLVKRMITEPDIYGRRFIGSSIASMIIKQDDNDTASDAYRRFVKRITGFATETHFDHRVSLADGISVLAKDDFAKFNDSKGVDVIQTVIPKTQNWLVYGSGVTYLITVEFLDSKTMAVTPINICFEITHLSDKVNIVACIETPDDSTDDEFDFPQDIRSSIGRLQYMLIAFIHHSLKALDVAMTTYANEALKTSVESTFQIMMKTKVHDKMEQDKGFMVKGPMELFDPRHIECIEYRLSDDHTEPVEIKLIAYDTTGAPTCGVVLTKDHAILTKIELDDNGKEVIADDISDQYPEAIPLIEEARAAMFFILKGALKEFPI